MRGGLPPARPDQFDRETPRGAAAGQRILRLGGVPGSASVLNQGPQVATTFYTFLAAGRVFSAGLTFAVGSNASYAASVTQLYARLKTGSGIVLCSVQLAVSGPTQNANGDDRFTGPQAGVPVKLGDTLQLDVNGGTSLGTGGLMRADCEVFFSLP